MERTPPQQDEISLTNTEDPMTSDQDGTTSDNWILEFDCASQREPEGSETEEELPAPAPCSHPGFPKQLE